MKETLDGHAGHAEHGWPAARGPDGPAELAGPGVPGGVFEARDLLAPARAFIALRSQKTSATSMRPSSAAFFMAA